MLEGSKLCYLYNINIFPSKLEKSFFKNIFAKKWGSPELNGNGVSGGVYGLAFIGALVYYIQHAATLWMGVIVNTPEITLFVK
jgi:hypothetical protein